MTSFQQWLRQPDDGDIVPVRGVVMRVAADQIRWLEQEVSRLKAQLAEAGPPTHIAFRDGESERELVWDGTGYRVPEGAETIDDVRAAGPTAAPTAADEVPADASEAAATPDDTGEPAAEADAAGDGGAEVDAGAGAGAEADGGDEAEASAPDAGAGDAPDEAKPAAADESAGEDGEDGEDEDFELPPEWQ